MSDNGGFPNYSGGQYPPPDPRLTDFRSNGPFRGQKGQPYEGDICVPAFVNWLGKLNQGIIDIPVHAVDWLPTICDLVECKPEGNLNWDGQNIWPFIIGNKDQYKNPRTFYWNYWNIRIALRYGDWKLVYPTENSDAELYNLADDPYEKNDLSDKEKIQLNLLIDKLSEVRATDRKGPAPWLLAK